MACQQIFQIGVYEIMEAKGVRKFDCSVVIITSFIFSFIRVFHYVFQFLKDKKVHAKKKPVCVDRLLYC